MLFDLFLLGGGSAGGPFYFALVDDAGHGDETPIDIDTDGSVYVAGQSSANVWFAKISSTPALAWHKVITLSGTDGATGIAIGGTTDLYIGGTTNTSTRNEMLIEKTNTSGSTVAWARRTNKTSGNRYGSAIAANSSSEAYLVGYGPPSFSTSNAFCINKYTSTGTVSWANAALGIGYAVACDSTGVVAGGVDSTNYPTVTRLTSAGAISWSKVIGSGTARSCRGVAIDSSGNTYAVLENGGSAGIYILKFDSTGAILWQRLLSKTGVAPARASICVDPSGNVYVAAAGLTRAVESVVAKYDSSGSLIWQRNLFDATNSVYPLITSLAADDNHVYIGASNSGALVAKLPADGSKTGTYTVGSFSLQYAATSWTSSTSSLASATWLTSITANSNNSTNINSLTTTNGGKTLSTVTI